MSKIIKTKEQIEKEVLAEKEPLHRKWYFSKRKELNEDQKRIKKNIQSSVQGRWRWQSDPDFREKRLAEIKAKKNRKEIEETENNYCVDYKTNNFISNMKSKEEKILSFKEIQQKLANRQW